MALRRTLRRTLIETLNTTWGYTCRLCFKQESRPETQSGGIKTREKRQESYKKSPGNVPRDVKGRVWIKRRGGQESCKRSRLKRKGGNKKDGVDSKERVVKERVSKEMGFVSKETVFMLNVKGNGFKGEDFQVKGESFKGDSVHDEFQMRGFQMRWCS
ncbi:hypothetical protein TNCV_1101101 [Trichonephila clavipes]|nr:hypothetical protein TNCV_1101101 [Trichonephila clavipes]